MISVKWVRSGRWAAGVTGRLLAEQMCTSTSVKTDHIAMCPGCTVYGRNDYGRCPIKKTKAYFSYFEYFKPQLVLSGVHQHIFQQFRVAGWQAVPPLAGRSMWMGR
jgi:hypothetical protein